MEEIREGWLLEGVPAYEGGRLSEVLYADGVGMARPEDGPENESQMIVVRDTHPYQFIDYMDALEAAGWRKTYEVRKDSLLAGAFTQDGKRVYAFDLPWHAVPGPFTFEAYDDDGEGLDGFLGGDDYLLKYE